MGTLQALVTFLEIGVQIKLILVAWKEQLLELQQTIQTDHLNVECREVVIIFQGERKGFKFVFSLLGPEGSE